MQETRIAQPVHGNLASRILHGIWSKTFVRAILFGAVSASAYFLVFSNESSVTEYFTRGGVYTFAVVGTAVAFSLIHGTFANYVLELVGIRANDSH